MDDYSQGYGPSAMGTVTEPPMTVGQMCKLLRAAKPLVWALAVVLGLLGVTLIVRYLWRKKPMEPNGHGGGWNGFGFPGAGT